MEASSIVKQQEQRRVGSARDCVYVVLENGELYPKLYSTYDAAHAAVLHKHADTLEEQRAECAEWNCIMSSKVDVEENRETGTTALYVEKDICITIQRYTVETSQ
jgi:hypothetical protein